MTLFSQTDSLKSQQTLNENEPPKSSNQVPLKGVKSGYGAFSQSYPGLLLFFFILLFFQQA